MSKKTNETKNTPVTEQAEGKVTVFGNFTPIKITALICAVIILGLLIAGAVVLIVDAVQRDAGFSYTDSKMDKYVELAGDDYNKLNLKLDIADTVATELEAKILSILNNNKPEDSHNDGKYSTDAIITAGDIVRIYYRGYVLNEDGTRDYQSGMTNLGGSAKGDYKPNSLVIGSGGLIPGFEGGLVGHNVNEYPTLSTSFITEGAVEDDYVLFVSYTRKEDKADGKTQSGSYVIIDLTLGKEKIDEIYGAGFYDVLVAQTINAEGFGAKLDDVIIGGNAVYDYSAIKVNYALPQYGATPIAVRFPAVYDKSPALQNKEAWFEVYTLGVKEYYPTHVTSLTDDMVTKLLEEEDAEVTADELATKYPELTTLAERYTKYLEDEIRADYLEDYDVALEKAIIAHYLDKAEIKKYPGKLQESIRNKYTDSFKARYSYFLSVYGSYGYNSSNYPISTFAKTYLGISDGTKWEAELHRLADEELATSLIIHYILQTENIDTSDAVIDAEVEKVIDKYYQEYEDAYFKANTDEKLEDYEGKEDELREKIVDYMYDNFEDDYFVNQAYRNLAMAKVKADFVKSAKILGEE